MQISFLLHGLVSLLASLNFSNISFKLPETSQLPASPHLTRPIITSYALLLLSTSIISCTLALDGLSPLTERMVAIGMIVYHIGPIMRAMQRIRRLGSEGRELGGARVHLAVHMIVVIALGGTILGLT